MSDAVKKLLAGRGITFSDQELSAILDPKWHLSTLCHDWRNHIDEDLVELWEELSEETRVVAYLAADHMAEDEEWE